MVLAGKMVMGRLQKVQKGAVTSLLDINKEKQRRTYMEIEASKGQYGSNEVNNSNQNFRFIQI
jgi:hypothetical protein